jgi:hypothetical protein
MLKKKGKDYEITKWKAEIRKFLADKRSTLTKQEQAAVNAQLSFDMKTPINYDVRPGTRPPPCSWKRAGV